jgi:hypothetical protein
MKTGVRFWQRWLVVATSAVAVFGLALAVVPAFARVVFGLLIFGSASGIDALGAAAAPYIGLLHGVLGAVMFGWAIALLLIVLGPFARGDRGGWVILAVSLAAWFVPDTALSLWTGFWPNAVLNSAIAVLFAIPLAATYSAFSQRPLT